jgi:putative endonuclease
MVGYMYILECADGSFYTGSTKDLVKRVWEHENFLGANYTKKKHPVKLVYSEEYKWIVDAFNREKQVQRWSHAKKKALIEGEIDNLQGLSKKKRSSRYTLRLRSGHSMTEGARSLSSREPGCKNRSLSSREPAYRSDRHDKSKGGRGDLKATTTKEQL